MVRAAASLLAAARGAGRQITLGLEFVAMQDNLHQLPDLVRWGARNRFGFVIVTQMLPYHRNAARAVAFDTTTDRALELFREWRARAAADGVDLDRYFDTAKKFHWSEGEARAYEYVNRMSAEAAERGITLNLEKLFRYDDGRLRRVEESFAEVEELARRENVTLHLPAALPSHERRCDFVEDGGAFVSLDGGLHPCYFLWHRYQCHLAGVVKHVRPETFGNVMEQDVLAIWSGAPWRTFRENVVRYDFPFCYDCNVALCDYVQDESFEQDCHVSRVPCGACLWCTGLFRCLQ
jgi:putative metalloenzyme radical SAM/SPASM domain maturase